MTKLALLLLLALALRLAAFAAFGGIVHADEVFQYTEQAHRLVFGQGLIPWEFRLGIRNWLFPGMLAGVMELARPLGDGPAVQNTAIALFMALASLPSLACAYCWGRRAAGEAAGLASFALVAAWPDMLLAGVHPLIDSIGADALIPALYLLDRARGPVADWRGGALLGLALALRPQFAPVAGLAALSCVWRRPPNAWWQAALASCVAPLIAGGLDWAVLGAPFASYLRYVAVNRAGAANFYGVSPWYEYLLVLPFSAGFLILPLAVWAWMGGRRLPFVAACAGTILLGFSLVTHKEFRFVLAAYPLLLTLCGTGAAVLAQRLCGALGVAEKPWHGPALALGCATISLINAPYVPASKLWLRGIGMVAAEHRISADPHACAVAITPPSLWYLTGGYTHLRPGIRITGFTPGDLDTSGFDYALAGPTTDLTAYGLTRTECWRNMLPSEALPQVCLWHRDVPCRPGAALVLPDPAFLHP